MIEPSCHICNQSGINVECVPYSIPTLFGRIESDSIICKSCKSIMDFCEMQYLEVYDFLSIKVHQRRKQISNHHKRNLK